MLRFFVRIILEYLPYAIVMIPLLKKFFLVCSGISLYKVLELWEIGGEKNAPRHDVDKGEVEYWQSQNGRQSNVSFLRRLRTRDGISYCDAEGLRIF